MEEIIKNTMVEDIIVEVEKNITSQFMHPRHLHHHLQPHSYQKPQLYQVCNLKTASTSAIFDKFWR